jgi:tetratricopeptide (TPR) repeat protein
MSIALFLLAAAGAGCVVPASEARSQETSAYAAFDGRGAPFGWRALAATGCTDAAVALLARYADANRDRLAAAEVREIAFHIGQSLALAGREQESIGAFERALESEPPPEWATYVKATLAFLRRDTAALQAARASYAELAPGSMRLRIIDGLVACPTEPYMKAAHCRM